MDPQRAGWAPAVREISIREFSNPSMRLQLKFQRDGYADEGVPAEQQRDECVSYLVVLPLLDSLGPGDEAVATLSASRATGGALASSTFRFTGRVDGAAIASGTGQLDASGHAVIKFKLPDTIEHGDGSLTAVVTDGGDMETVSKTMPLVLSSINLHVYPESGDLVEGLESRV